MATGPFSTSSALGTVLFLTLSLLSNLSCVRISWGFLKHSSLGPTLIVSSSVLWDGLKIHISNKFLSTFDAADPEATLSEPLSHRLV
jgi:hypothetical protein